MPDPDDPAEVLRQEILRLNLQIMETDDEDELSNLRSQQRSVLESYRKQRHIKDSDFYKRFDPVYRRTKPKRQEGQDSDLASGAVLPKNL